MTAPSEPESDTTTSQVPVPTSRGPMRTFTFALSWFNDATQFVGVTAVDILAASPRDAVLRLEALQQNVDWVKAIPGIDLEGYDDDELIGIEVGDFLLVKETTAPPDSIEGAAVPHEETSASPHEKKHAEAWRLIEKDREARSGVICTCTGPMRLRDPKGT